MTEPPGEILSKITTAVSVATGRSVEELPPLSESIDPDGLVALVTGEPSHDVTITFAYAGQRVLVHSDHTVYVRPIRDADPDPTNGPSATNR
jgi:hypothetical protein